VTEPTVRQMCKAKFWEHSTPDSNSLAAYQKFSEDEALNLGRIPVLQVCPHPLAPSPILGNQIEAPSPALGGEFRVRATKVGCTLNLYIKNRTLSWQQT
jgi:hypothetical protein